MPWSRNQTQEIPKSARCGLSLEVLLAWSGRGTRKEALTAGQHRGRAPHPSTSPSRQAGDNQHVAGKGKGGSGVRAEWPGSMANWQALGLHVLAGENKTQLPNTWFPSIFLSHASVTKASEQLPAISSERWRHRSALLNIYQLNCCVRNTWHLQRTLYPRVCEPFANINSFSE